MTLIGVVVPLRPHPLGSHGDLHADLISEHRQTVLS
jgi:hypothetical protein